MCFFVACGANFLQAVFSLSKHAFLCFLLQTLAPIPPSCKSSVITYEAAMAGAITNSCPNLHVSVPASQCVSWTRKPAQTRRKRKRTSHVYF